MGGETQKHVVQNALNVDCESESKRIEIAIQTGVREKLRRRGVVVALSGGIDSSVVAALCVRALGSDRVFGLLLPEKDSSAETRTLSRAIVAHLGIRAEVREITDLLEAAGCYRFRDEAIRSVIPEYDSSCGCKMVLSSLCEREQLRLFSIVVDTSDGRRLRARLSLQPYLQIVAATNFKQRTRKMLEYFHADLLHYAVAGTANRIEHDQGFFVKLGDGAADLKPIAHLYKTQVYQMARFLGLPKEICERTPTTDTYSMPQDQEEFYFSVPYYMLDFCLYARNHGMSPEETAGILSLEVALVARIYRDIDAKRRTSEYLHMTPLLVETYS